MRIFSICNAKTFFVINHQVGELVVAPRNSGILLHIVPTVRPKELQVGRTKRFCNRQTAFEGLILDDMPHVATDQSNNQSRQQTA